jgi:hypothetical protein
LTQCSSAQDVAPETSAGPTVADVSAIADEDRGRFLRTRLYYR